MRTLGELLEGLVGAAALRACASRPVTALADDSRRVVPGALFVALRGTRADGARYIDDAIARGATAVLSEPDGADSMDSTGNPERTGSSDRSGSSDRTDGPDITDYPASRDARHAAAAAAATVGADPRGPLRLVAPDARYALAVLAARWHGLTEARLQLAGVTGTNGKSTTAFMMRAIMQAAGRSCGLLGTVHHDLVGRRVPAAMTTPGPLELCALLAECREHGAEAAVLEVSSHALDQKRTAGLRFQAAAFTNLSGDHLDYHRTLTDYQAAKARLFSGLDADAWAVVNRDDPVHEVMLRDCRARVLRFALDQPADITATILRTTIAGTQYRMSLAGRELTLENALVGRHNVYNALTAAGLAHALGVAPDAIAEGLASVRNVPGRLQRVPNPLGLEVFVDYAHTDDALRNVLSVLRPLTKRRLICVFGCGGDRDRTKRPRMAQAAGELAHAVIVTSDNPRSEDPHAIIAEILTGFAPADRRRVVVEVDRAAAIRLALAGAKDGDVVLIAGKGHEDYQIIGAQRLHFDDAETAGQAAAELALPAAAVAR